MKSQSSSLKVSQRRKSLSKRPPSARDSREGGLLSLLKQDHRKLQSLCEKILKEESGASPRAQETFEEFKTLLIAHSKAEEAVFYEPIRQRTAKDGDDKGHDGVLEGFEEHHVAELLVTEISELEGNDERWMAKMSVLCEALDHHIEEEEGEIFKAARKELKNDEFAELGERFNREKLALMTQH